MKNNAFLALVLFGLVSLGLAWETNVYGSEKADIEVKDDNDKPTKPAINIPNLQSIYGTLKSDHQESDDGLHYEIGKLLNELHLDERNEDKKDEKEKSYEPKKEPEKHREGVPKREHKKHHEGGRRRGCGRAALERLRRKVSELLKLHESLKHVREDHHTKDLNKEKAEKIGYDKEKSKDDVSLKY